MLITMDITIIIIMAATTTIPTTMVTTMATMDITITNTITDITAIMVIVEKTMKLLQLLHHLIRSSKEIFSFVKRCASLCGMYDTVYRELCLSASFIAQEKKFKPKR